MNRWINININGWVEKIDKLTDTDKLADTEIGG